MTYVGPATHQNDDQYMGKVDYNLGRQQISGRYFDTRFKQPPAMFTDNILAADSGGSQVHIRNVAVNHTFTARPTLLFNTWFGWNSQVGGTIPSALFGWPDIGVKIAQPEGEPPESYLSIGGAFTARRTGKASSTAATTPSAKT